MGYSFLGMTFLGTKIAAFSTFWGSLETVLLLSLLGAPFGIFDYQALLDSAIYHSETILATLFFWSYAIIAQMLLLNVLLAIIVDAYVEVKDGMQNSDPIHFTVAIHL